MTHLMKYTSNYVIKCACVLANIHSSSANDGDKGLQFILSLQYSCKKKEECCMHYILCFHLIKDLINVQLSCHLFFLSCISLHLINHTPYYFCKSACVIQNIHTSLALCSTLLKGAAVYLAILFTLCLASQ